MSSHRIIASGYNLTHVASLACFCEKVLDQTYSLVIVRFYILYDDFLVIVVLLGSFCSLKEGIFEPRSGHWAWIISILVLATILHSRSQSKASERYIPRIKSWVGKPTFSFAGGMLTFQKLGSGLVGAWLHVHFFQSRGYPKSLFLTLAVSYGLYPWLEVMP